MTFTADALPDDVETLKAILIAEGEDARAHQPRPTAGTSAADRGGHGAGRIRAGQRRCAASDRRGCERVPRYRASPVPGPRHPAYEVRLPPVRRRSVQAPSPARLIESGLPTESTVAHVLVSKFEDHLPLYRQAQIFSRQGVTLDRSTPAHWLGRASFVLRQVFETLAADLRRSSKLFMAETPAPVPDAGRGCTKTGYLWALARDDRPWGESDPPGVVYFYADGRDGAHAERFLAGDDDKGFGGVLQVDGDGGYRRLAEGGAIALAFCWAHARRKFCELEKCSGSAIAAE